LDILAVNSSQFLEDCELPILNVTEGSLQNPLLRSKGDAVDITLKAVVTSRAAFNELETAGPVEDDRQHQTKNPFLFYEDDEYSVPNDESYLFPDGNDDIEAIGSVTGIVVQDEDCDSDVSGDWDDVANEAKEERDIMRGAANDTGEGDDSCEDDDVGPDDQAELLMQNALFGSLDGPVSSTFIARRIHNGAPILASSISSHIPTELSQEAKASMVNNTSFQDKLPCASNIQRASFGTEFVSFSSIDSKQLSNLKSALHLPATANSGLRSGLCNIAPNIPYLPAAASASGSGQRNLNQSTQFPHSVENTDEPLWFAVLHLQFPCLPLLPGQSLRVTALGTLLL
jgi:hypothetical protein